MSMTDTHRLWLLSALLVVRGGDSAMSRIEEFHQARWEAEIYDET